MSNDIQYDPLLARYLADELNRRIQSRGTTAAPLFAPDLSVTLPLDRGEQLRIDLHPTRGWVRLIPDSATGDLTLDAICEGVTAPLDERSICISLHETGRFRDQLRTLVLELHTNQWNAILVGGDGRILNILRARRAGRRPLFPGEKYVSIPGEPRYGSRDIARAEARRTWTDRLGPLQPSERRRALLTGFAWTGTANADWILAPSQGEGLESSFDRWWWLKGLPPARPAILHVGERLQPYPLRLADVDADPSESLLQCMARLAGAEPVRTAMDPRVARAQALAEERLGSLERRLDRLRQELSAAGEAERLKSIGDLLLAKLHLVPRGEADVELEGWEGESVLIELDPSLTPADNASRYYDLAGRRRRAEEQLPKLLEQAEAEVERWRGAAEKVAAGGEVPAWINAELDRLQSRATATRDDAPSTPYRTYRTSGGLEVRVGRNARDNDRLTFRSSSPNDVWLHARSVPGSHVILRWPDADGSPPARDLAEAAQIAAVFSRARTSGTVAVDWTRRKYVRKPRGAPPGAVIPSQVRTLFVEPDEAFVESMREDG